MRHLRRRVIAKRLGPFAKPRAAVFAQFLCDGFEGRMKAQIVAFFAAKRLEFRGRTARADFLPERLKNAALYRPYRAMIDEGRLPQRPDLRGGVAFEQLRGAAAGKFGNPVGIDEQRVEKQSRRW